MNVDLPMLIIMLGVPLVIISHIAVHFDGKYRKARAAAA